MKNRVLVALACIIALTISVCFSGCAAQLSGSVDTVVEDAQDLSADEKAHVEVTGEISPFDTPVAKDSGQLLIFSSQNNSSSGNSVFLYFDELSEEDVDALTSGRITVSGELIPGSTHTDSISLNHCTVK